MDKKEKLKTKAKGGRVGYKTWNTVFLKKSNVQKIKKAFGRKFSKKIKKKD